MLRLIAEETEEDGEIMSEGAFKHITVTAAEEDDVVIHAGLVPSEHSQSEDSASVSSASDGLASHDLASESSTLEDRASEHQASKSTPVDSMAPAKTPSGTRPRKARDDEYRPTTLEDLQGKPMPTIQKAVIIAAIICIIGAIVYYFAFMR